MIKKITSYIKENLIVVLCLILAVFLAVSSGNPFSSIGADVSSRFFRNLLLIAALVLPIMSGVGLNFGITLGAMSAELAVVIVMILQLDNNAFSLILWILFTMIICIITGWLLAALFNRCKGHEMIAGLLVGFFANGIYDLILMVFFGDILKIDWNGLALSKGLPIKATIGLSDALTSCMDKAIPVAYYFIVMLAVIIVVIWSIVSLILQIRKNKAEKSKAVIGAVVKIVITVAVAMLLMNIRQTLKFLVSVDFPMATALFSAAVIAFVVYIMRTKLGHDFVSVRNDRKIAASVGINIDRTRTLSIILSTIIAGFGQIIYIQNLGTMNTYLMHNTVGTYAIAAILIGGATVKNANIKNVLIGNILFQIIYGCAPNAAKVMMGNSQLGEYFRVFLCYAIIAIAILSNALNEVAAKKRKMEEQ